MKQHDVYIVRSLGARWAVCLNDKTLGVFAERPEALQAAIVVSEASGRAGRTSVVVTEDPNGALRTIWEFGRDAYSPLT